MNSPNLNVEERASLVGHICFQWSYLEYLISNAVWNLLKLDKPTGMIVTGRMDLRGMVKLASELAMHLDAPSELVEELTRFKKKLEEKDGIAARRNRIVHGVLSSREGDPNVMSELHRTKRFREREPVTVDFLKSTHEDIVAEMRSLVGVWEQVGINVH